MFLFFINITGYPRLWGITYSLAQEPNVYISTPNKLCILMIDLIFVSNRIKAKPVFDIALGQVSNPVGYSTASPDKVEFGSDSHKIISSINSRMEQLNDAGSLVDSIIKKYSGRDFVFIFIP